MAKSNFETWCLEEIEQAEGTAQAVRDGTLWVGSSLNPSDDEIEMIAQDYTERALQLRAMLSRVRSK